MDTQNITLGSEENQEYFALTDQQLELLAAWEIEPNAINYNCHVSYCINGNLDEKKFQKSLVELVNHFDSLRVRIKKSEDGRVMQYIGEKVEDLSCVYVDLWSPNPNEDKKKLEKQAKSFISEKLTECFKLYEEDLHLFLLVRYDENKYDFVFAPHHINCDGQSGSILMSALSVIYNQGLDQLEKLDSIRQHPNVYLEYYNSIPKEVIDLSKIHWVNKLESIDVEMNYQRTAVGYKKEMFYFNWNESLLKSIKRFCKQQRTTPFLFMSAVYSCLLYRYFSQESLCLWYPQNIRAKGANKLYGFYVVPMPMSVECDDNEKFVDLLGKIRDQRKVDNQYIPLTQSSILKLLNKMHIDHRALNSIAEVPLIDRSLELDNLDIESLGVGNGDAEHHLSFMYDVSQGEFKGKFTYNGQMFTEEFIMQLAGHLQGITAALLNDPNQRLSEIDYMSENEKSRILSQFNSTENDYQDDKLLHELFEEQVKIVPENTAIVFNSQKLSYKQLNSKANQLARHIRKMYQLNNGEEMGADTPIALCMNRGIEMIIGILAVLKAGGAYVPLEPSYPRERISYILQDTRAKILLSTSEVMYEHSYLANLSDSALLILCDLTYAEEQHNLSAYTKTTDLAYIIYTSGTTGVPKGVMIEHHSVINTLNSIKEIYALSHQDKITQFTSYIFDYSVAEIFISLIQGAELHLLPESCLKDSEALSHYLTSHRINYAYVPPVMLAQLPRKNYPDLKALIYGGEAIDHKTGEYWSAKLDLYNCYGPTEATIYATSTKVEKDLQIIGRPIQNTKLYVLDNQRQIVPIGVCGELYISGKGLARGYLNNLEQNEQRFLPNFFADAVDIENGYDRIYKTGDIVRYLPSGNLEYLGRSDTQIKIRGYRVELSEIEHRMMGIPDITQAVVVCNKRVINGAEQTYLAGYFCSENSLTENQIRIQLSSQLPEFMVPSVFINLPSIPMKKSGKIDRAALPIPQFDNMDSEFVEPKNELQSQLAKIWGSLLDIKSVSIDKDFFALGGDSIIAIQIAHKITSVTGITVTVADLLKHKTIHNLSLAMKNNEEVITIPKTKMSKPPLSFAQERLWFIEQYNPGNNAYHIPIVLEFSELVDIKNIKYALSKIMDEQEVLRTVIQRNDDGSYYQNVLHKGLAFNEICCDTTEEFENKLESDIMEQFDLSVHYPIRVNFYNVLSRRYILINMHHIAFDGWSLDIFANNLLTYYEAYQKGDLPAQKTSMVQYKDYAVWQREFLTGEKLNRLLQYWRDKLEGWQVLNIPTDRHRKAVFDYSGNVVEFSLDQELSAKLRQLAVSESCSLYTILLTGFYILLYKYTGQNDLILGNFIANRNQTQCENLVGFFSNTLAIRQIIDSENSIQEIIQSVHASLVEAQEYQELPFEKLVEALKVPKDTSRQPLFQATFSFQDHSSSLVTEYYKPIEKLNYKIAKYDIELFAKTNKSSISGMFNYAASLFEVRTIEKLADYYQIILMQIAENVSKKASSVKLLSQTEYEFMLAKADACEPVVNNKTLVDKFQEQVSLYPDNTAVVFENHTLSYRQLHERSNQLASHILKNYDQRGDNNLICLLLDRSVEMMISILAVLKLGAGYVPIDPACPSERLSYILEDVKPRAVLVSSKLASRIPEASVGYKAVIVDDLTYQSESADEIEVEIKPDDLAYAIYTSGTTGAPKAVLQTHTNVLRLFTTTDKHFNFKNKDVWTLFHSYVFDFSVWEMWGALLFGGKLIIPSIAEMKDIKQFFELCLMHEVSVLNLTPRVFYQFSECISQYLDRPIKSIKTVVLGGEKLDATQLNSWWRYLNLTNVTTQLINMYGTTETTVHATLKKVIPSELAVSNIGKPLDDMIAYILDSNLVPVPIGMIGELYIGGAGLAKAYLNQPTLTAQRFISNPFALGKLYKTGDLVRWLSNGEIEYIGRNDFQVKINGYRIEIPEVEAALNAYDGIKQSYVLARNLKNEDNNYNDFLVAYYTLETGHAVDKRILIQFLSHRLPEYMLPKYFIELDKIPLTINGKIDTKSLPEPVVENINQMETVPLNKTEIQLTEIWEELLETQSISPNDNFFDRGGNSLLTLRLQNMIRKQMGFDIKVTDIFQYPTIRSLSKNIQRTNSIAYFDRVTQTDTNTPGERRKKRIISSRSHG